MAWLWGLEVHGCRAYGTAPGWAWVELEGESLPFPFARVRQAACSLEDDVGWWGPSAQVERKEPQFHHLALCVAAMAEIGQAAAWDIQQAGLHSFPHTFASACCLGWAGVAVLELTCAAWAMEPRLLLGDGGSPHFLFAGAITGGVVGGRLILLL